MSTRNNPQLPVRFNLNQVFGKIHVSSVLKDMIYVLAFFIVFVLLLAVAHVETWIIIVAFIFLGGFLLYFGYCYNWLMHNDRDSLKSEDYQLEKQQMEMMGTKAKEVSAQVIEGETIIEKPKTKTQTKSIARKGVGEK